MIKGKNIFAVLDIGTSKISVIIVKRNFTNDCEILAMSTAESSGIRSGKVINLEAAKDSIINVIDLAENEADVRVKNVFVSLNSSFLISSRNSQDLNLANQEIELKDLNKMLFQVLEKYDKQEVEIVHTIPYEYILDSSRGIVHPEGLFGNKLTGFFHIICAPANYLINITKCLEKCQLSVEGYIASGFASAIASLRQDEMEFGAAVIEIGGGAATISVFYKNNLIFTEGVPYGGIHITNDIAKVLNLDVAVAEKIKLAHGSVYSMNGIIDNIINVENDEIGEKTIINQSELNEIIKARLEEVLNLLKNKVLEADMMEVISKIVVVGGSSTIIGINELVWQIFGKKSRTGAVEEIDNIKPNFFNASFVTVAGMYKNIEQIRIYNSKDIYNDKKGLLNRLWGWFKDNF